MESQARGNQWVTSENAIFTYEGRIDFEDPKAPVFVYPCSCVKFGVTGRNATLVVENVHSYFENALGVLVDGEYRGKIVLHDGQNPQGEALKWFLLRLDAMDGAKEEITSFLAKTDGGSGVDSLIRTYDLSPFLDGKEHEITIFKRMDACHYVRFYGVIALENELQRTKDALPERRIEVYGDSISCGEVSEAVACVGGDDPQGHEGVFSNSFYSYPWILARRLGARLHDIAQGGISLHDGTGYFDMPNTKGMLSTFDKIQNNPSLGERTVWDFGRYVPHVVIVAIGQNDAHPENVMAKDYDGTEAVQWRKDYAGFVRTLRGKYPKALIVLTTTILGHDAAWDRAIGQVCDELGDPKVRHFLYSKNGCGTSGHVRWPEAEQMASEMQKYLESFGEELWAD